MKWIVEAESIDDVVLGNYAICDTPLTECKDCKHYENDVMGNPWGVCCHQDWITDNCGSLVDQNGWCYRAERRTDE